MKLLLLLLLLACGNYETAGSRRRLSLTLIKSLGACCAQTTDPMDSDTIGDTDARRINSADFDVDTPLRINFLRLLR
ncbi:uncharacterized protein Dsimw501_GD28565, isoform A [Drosophila simulans]|uniref:Uncharacterized protein, isoform A n=1 Tax=Drosophila simulans TaxID=7240 RepID=A0A0J9R1Q2_DROSI|nr:uncharacterized protein Dsimw501_GD28565, isoform A [Drosophila simulans]